MYEAVDNYDATTVGGANPTVGVMGWFTVGGHASLSSSFCIGAHHFFDAKAVLSSGEVVTMNVCQHPDLIYAI
jgi:hypothetical protein